MSNGKIILVTGGARSGKSTFAEKLAATTGASVAYIATAQIFDEEMRFRIDLHQQRRPSTWETYEAPFNAERALEAAAERHTTILFDCLTIYLSNILCSLTQTELLDEGAVNAQAMAAVEALQAAAVAARERGVTVIFVTNEVGAGIVPENHLARLYRDVSGLANQRLAAVADSVYAVIAGLPVDVKKLAVKI